jgi:hypothetical protein
MYPNLSQRFDAALPAKPGAAGTSFRLAPPIITSQAPDLTDRQIEQYMLPHPNNPSLSLQALYAAVRNQMVLDGCP